MKKFVLLLILLAVLSGIILYQSPVLRHQVNSALPVDISKKLDNIHQKMLNNKTKPLYKWKNNKGEWIVSDTPPTDGTSYETLQYNPNTNVIPAEPISGKN